MKKITSYKIAEELVNKMVETGKEIILWDEIQSNRIAKVNSDNGSLIEVLFTDTVNGEVYRRDMYRGELKTALWQNRADVNRLNDLASL